VAVIPKMTPVKAMITRFMFIVLLLASSRL
jgi:hypothetical protein